MSFEYCNFASLDDVNGGGKHQQRKGSNYVRGRWILRKLNIIRMISIKQKGRHRIAFKTKRKTILRNYKDSRRIGEERCQDLLLLVIINILRKSKLEEIEEFVVYKGDNATGRKHNLKTVFSSNKRTL